MKRLFVALALLVAHLGVAAPPARAASADGQFVKVNVTLNGSYIPIMGAFDCDEGDDGGPFPETYEEIGVLLYAPGTAADYLWTDMERSPSFTRTQTTLDIRGTYVPISGDFDGDRCSDILWYGPGSAPDSIWWGGPNGFTKGSPINISGHYMPVSGFFGGAAPGIYWYAPEGTERLWLGTGNRAAPFRNVTTRQVVADSYRPALFYNPANGAGELFWHGPEGVRDTVWRFHTASNGFVVDDITIVPVSGSHRPASCGTSVVLHDPVGPDKLLTSNGPSYVVHDLSIAGSYRVAASGRTSARCHVIWHRPGSASDQIWFPSNP